MHNLIPLQDEEAEFLENCLVPILDSLRGRELGTTDPGSKVEELRLTTHRGVNGKVFMKLKELKNVT